MATKRSRQIFEADIQRQEAPFVFYGTPLPPLDEKSRDDGTYVPVWQQEVTDDRGRKRLHGAFTGGFSAGYYNTVGSKEGWTPSSFVSSRSNRAKDVKKYKEQRPEDYMDDEDLEEADNARTLSTDENFGGFGTVDDSKRQSGLMDLFRPSGETIGTKLLRRMGWREGQGIGPRVHRKPQVDDSGIESSSSHLSAPEDPPMVAFNRKSGYKGLGYDAEVLPYHGSQAIAVEDVQGTPPNHADRIFSIHKPDHKAVKLNKKTGFGMGVLNDTGSDDEDPYEMGPKISYNKVLGGNRRSQKKQHTTATNANPPLKEKPLFVAKKHLGVKGLTDFRRCRDGRLPLDGFVLSSELDAFSTMSLDESDFQPIEVPTGWTPHRSTVATEQSGKYVSTQDAARASHLDAQSRAKLLGEAQLPGKSVFDFLSPSARNRLVHASGKPNLPPALNQKPTSDTTHTQESLPGIDASTAEQALTRCNTGWTPYAEDAAKQSRYLNFLRKAAGVEHSDASPQRPSTMTPSELKNETVEFARAAEVFKPVSGLMASRFTSSSSSTPAITNSGLETSHTPSDLLTRPATKAVDPAVQAAHAGMFGPGLTRSIEPWHPTRLLCKRFNVPVPDNVRADDRQTDETDKPRKPYGTPKWDTSVTTSGPVAGRFQSAGFQQTEAREPKHNWSVSTGLETTIENAQLPSRRETVDPEHNEALEKERPGHAVFTAIFGSDDDDDDEGDD